MNPLYANLPTTIFEKMSALARETGAINLGQGFPDAGWPRDVLEAGARALTEGYNQYPPMPGVPERRQAIGASISIGSARSPSPPAQPRRSPRRSLRSSAPATRC